MSSRVRCLPLACELSTKACARRHEVANGPTTGQPHWGSEGQASHHTKDRLRASPCKGCAVGAESRAKVKGGAGG